MKFVLFLFTLFSALMLLGAEDIDVSQKLRIEELMPRKDQVTFIAIDPFIPNNYVALGRNKDSDYFDYGMFWGPEEVLKAYFMNADSLSVPILLVGFADTISQPKEGVLDMSYIKTSLEKEAKNLSFDFGKWGEYPYCKVSGKLKGQDFNMAYIGLNESSGAVLLINLVSPNTSNGKIAGEKFWNDFFEHTKQLPELLTIRVKAGLELHPDYTMVDVAGRKAKVTAEKRKSDRKIQFVILPEDETLTFRFKNAWETPMGISWHFFEPVLKIEGAFVLDKGWIDYSMFTTVLIKEVAEFTPLDNKNKNIFVKEFYTGDKIEVNTSPYDSLDEQIKRIQLMKSESNKS